MKKPFKETKVGQWLKEKAPNVLAVVGDVLPDKGVLGIVKNLISKDSSIPSEQRLEFEKMIQEYELELDKLEFADKANARQRETDFIKATGHIDWMHTVVGILVMIAFVLMTFLLFTQEFPEKSEHIIINLVGILEGAVITVVGYYYGSSAGSRIKDMKAK
jgi:hypothetical protein